MTPDQLIQYCSALEWTNADSVGYIPKPALEKYAHRNQIIPALENDEPCGYVLFNDAPGPRLSRMRPATCTIYQACIQYDARRILHGTALVTEVIRRAARHGLPNVDCYVSDTIPANDFWRALGFTQTGTRPGGRKRRRTLNHWELRPFGVADAPPHSVNGGGSSPLTPRLPRHGTTVRPRRRGDSLPTT